MKKIFLAAGVLCNGFRLDSGVTTAGSYAVPNAMDLTEQQKGNIVMKIVKIAKTNSFTPCEKFKISELSKEEGHGRIFQQKKSIPF